jgi:hypothetical protein
MSISSCIGQQPAYDSQNSGLSEGSWRSSYTFFKPLGEENTNQPSSKLLVQNGTKGKFISFCCMDFYVTFEHCGFMFYACFLLNNSVCSVKAIKFVWRAPLTQTSWDAYTAGIPSSMSLIRALEWQHTERDTTQLIVECNWHVHLKHYKMSQNSMTRQILSHTQISAFQSQQN